MSNMGKNRGLEYLIRYGILLVGAGTNGIWANYYMEFLTNHDISIYWGCTFPLIVITSILIFPEIFRIIRGFYLFITKKFKFTKIINIIQNSTKYFGDPLFYVDEDDQRSYQVFFENPYDRIRLNFKRYMFQEFPIFYYNVAAKTFLNWIDFFYLKLLKDLHEQIGARIIIALHFDEEIYRDGYFTDNIKLKYDEIFKKSKKIIQNIVGYNAIIIDERWFLKHGSKGARSFCDYFFGIMISKINKLVLALYKNEISLFEFYHMEANLVSILSTILTAKKYAHLFVLDYEGSFEIWNDSPFQDLKHQNRIFFIKCRKIKGPNGERIPSWSPEDGINLTDDTDTLKKKVNQLDKVILDTILNLLNITKYIKEDKKREILFEKLKNIKSEVKL